jgi:hypothetical protein
MRAGSIIGQILARLDPLEAVEYQILLNVPAGRRRGRLAGGLAADR